MADWTSGRVGVYEAKTQLSRILEYVKQGAEVTITQRGRAVARIVAVTDPEESIVERMIARRKALGATLDRPLREYIEEGRL
ncbi:MAG TPA: type II toxin-antitoxin system prevent-host-death family antitoxin [Armatimonadota bacterium]|jgi:prevent-host-death family protein